MKRRNIATKSSHHLSFLVRCWQEHSVHAGHKMVVWRFSLQNLHTNQRHGFATLEALLLSLQSELADDPVD